MLKALQHYLLFGVRLSAFTVDLAAGGWPAWKCFDANTILYGLLQVQYPAAVIALD
jgi:hypothetical protein